MSGVKDVAVIGVKSEREGEVPRAYIVRYKQLTLSERKWRSEQFLAENLGFRLRMIRAKY